MASTAAMWSGVVPQQPPTMFTLSSAMNRRCQSASSRGLSG
jgi:hypothetical protein